MSRITVFYDHIRNACIQENMPFKEVAKKLTEAGISGTDIEYKELLGIKGLLLNKRLVNAGLPVSSVYCIFNWNSKEKSVDYIKVLKRLKKFDIKYLLAIPGFVDEEDRVKEQEDGSSISKSHLKAMEYFLPFLSKLCKDAKAYGIQVIMEDYDSVTAPFGKSEEVKWFMDRIPELGCAFDTGNFFFFGEDSYEVLPKFIDRIAYVHCKDRSLTPVKGEGYAVTVDDKKLFSAAVGSGVIKMAEILDDIKKSGYDGPYAIEHFGSLKQYDDMLKSAEYLRSRI